MAAMFDLDLPDNSEDEERRPGHRLEPIHGSGLDEADGASVGSEISFQSEIGDCSFPFLCNGSLMHSAAWLDQPTHDEVDGQGSVRSEIPDLCQYFGRSSQL